MSIEKNLLFKERIKELFAVHDIYFFGIANLHNISHIRDGKGGLFRKAVSFAVPMNAKIMGGIKQGPTKRYADEYARVNEKIDSVSSMLVSTIEESGYTAKPIPASKRTDPKNIKGGFPHKTAATQAGMGWIGRNCQLITRKHGPWVRLGTVFTDLPVQPDVPVTKSYCGDCRKCIEACPADALLGNLWYPGIPREELLDVWSCDRWKKEQYYHFNKGHNCGICAAVCPFGK